MAKKKEFPDLNKDGETTFADVLIGRGVRERKAVGGVLAKATKKAMSKSTKRKIANESGLTNKDEIKLDRMKEDLVKAERDLQDLKKTAVDDSQIDKEDFLESYIDELETDIKMLEEGVSEEEARGLLAKGGKVMKPAKTRYTYAEGKEVDKQMVGLGISVSPITAEMESDKEMEDGYVDFIVEQSLSPEEQKFLMDKLESEPELSVVFDKVMDTATEFAGSGPVEGPGSGVSDSIPARLSDGEFVFTAKATEQIGADRLQSMMKDAEMQADAGRQEMQEGGEVEETKVDRFGKPVDKDIAEDEIKKGMMSTNPRLQ